MIFHPLPEGVAEHFGDGVYYGLEVEIGVGSKEVAKDARRCLGKEVAAPFFDEFAHLLRALMELLHDPGEKGKVTSVIGHEWAGDAPIADGTQGAVSLPLEVLEHLGARVLQPPSPVRFVCHPFHEGGDAPHLLVE